MPTLPITRQCTVPVLAVEDNLAAHAIGDEAVVVMCEVTNATDHLIAGGSVQAVGYDRRGGIVAMAEASELVFWPHQSRAVQLALRALDAPIATVCVFTACEAEERPLEYEESGAA